MSSDDSGTNEVPSGGTAGAGNVPAGDSPVGDPTASSPVAGTGTPPAYLLSGTWTKGMWLAAIAAVLLVFMYAIALCVLAYVVLTDEPKSEQWERVIYLLTGLETIAFAAVGFLFGREVVRSQATVATEAVTKAQANVAHSSGLAAQSKIEERKAQAAERAEKERAERLAKEKNKLVTEILASESRVASDPSDVVDRLLERHILEPVTLEALRTDLAQADFGARRAEDGRVVVLSQIGVDELTRLRVIAETLGLDDSDDS